MRGEVQLEPPGIIRASDSDPLLENQKGGLFRPSSSEIEDGGDDIHIEAAAEEEAGLLPSCRICLESESEFGDALISPCMCKGTQQFVHRSCLDHWRSVKEGFAFSHCTTCKAQFHLRVEMYEDNSWRQIKFRLFVARDVFLVFLAVQTFIAALGGSVYVMDGDGTFRNSFSDGWDPSMEACFALVIVFIVIFAILGIAYGFLAATMGIQRIWQKHYHILTKRELTKEYIVEDLHGCYSPPKLDPEHEQRLKLLKLL
ncbi:unnamed protein product [Rhodiola kirilowii]